MKLVYKSKILYTNCYIKYITIQNFTMGRNCLNCGNRQYIIETVWDETKDGNVIVRKPRYITKEWCKYCLDYLQFTVSYVQAGKNTDNINMNCHGPEPYEGWFDKLKESVDKLIEDRKNEFDEINSRTTD